MSAVAVTTKTASKVLAAFAIVCGVIVLLLIGSFAATGLLVNLGSMAMGMPNADALLLAYTLQFAAFGAGVGIGFAVIGVVLVILAMTRKARAGIWLIITAWAILGFAIFTILLTFLAAALNQF